MIRVVTSDRWAEVEQALGVVHDTFVEAGYLTPRPSRRRMVLPYLNPGTLVHLGLVDGEPAAALAMVPDGPFGLPSERAFGEQIAALREGPGVLEIGSLGVRAAHRAHTRPLAAMAFAAIARVLEEHNPHTMVISSVEPTAARFYATFAFAPLGDGERPLFGAPAVLLGAPAGAMLASIAPGRGAMGRRVAALAREQRPAWWADLRTGAPSWPAERLAELLAEAGELERARVGAAILAPVLAARR